jgi:hypothetical protein
VNGERDKVNGERDKVKERRYKSQGVDDEKKYGIRKNNIEMLHLNEKLICRK